MNEGLFFLFLSSGLFLGWSLGANDAANLFGTAVGSRMIKFKTAALIASVFVILGAVFTGSGASETLSHLGKINAIAGAFMVALAAALAIYWMSSSGLPVSTSQAIVGAIIGWNFYSGNPTDSDTLIEIVSSWVLCPLLSAGVAVFIFWGIKLWMKHLKVHLFRMDSYVRTGLILIGAFGAYALGANNIANVMGVFVDSSPLHALSVGEITFSKTQILFFIGGISIAVGIFTYSQNTIKTIGNNLMHMTPIVALIVVFAQSLVLFLFAFKPLKLFLDAHGLPSLPLVPVSSSHAVIGAILGIGVAKGGRNINWKIVGKIAFGWFLTPVIAAAVCFVSLFFLENVFNLSVYEG